MNIKYHCQELMYNKYIVAESSLISLRQYSYMLILRIEDFEVLLFSAGIRSLKLINDSV